jgi:hypothetical protein
LNLVEKNLVEKPVRTLVRFDRFFQELVPSQTKFAANFVCALARVLEPAHPVSPEMKFPR